MITLTAQSIAQTFACLGRGPRLFVGLLLLAMAAARADVSDLVPTTALGGSGTVGAIQGDDGVFYSAAKGNMIDIGGFPSVGGDISSVVLHVKFTVDSGYSGTNPILVNGVSSAIVPSNGDTQRSASINITAGNFRIDTWPEITALAVTFRNNDVGQGQSVHFDSMRLVVTHDTPVYAPPTWSDEFNDSGPPNPAFWTFEQGFVRNEELQWYQSNNAWQENGNLIIEARREQVLNPNYNAGSSDWKLNRQYADYTSASIKSTGKYSFQYGRMQVRAKIPCYPGSWPAIWTLGDNGEWPSNGECDVLEYYATDSVLANCARGTTTRWTAAWDAVKKPVSTFTPANPNWRNEYHVWTMQWDDQNVRLYLDNNLLNTIPQSWLVNPVTTWGPAEPFKQPHYILLNLAIGSNGGNPGGTTFPLRYEIDHVRVWEGLTNNNVPTDITLSPNSVQEGLAAGTVVGDLNATDVDAAEVHGFTLVTGTGSTHNSSFEIISRSDETTTSVLRTKAVLNYADGPTRSIRVRVTDIEGTTYEKILAINVLTTGNRVTYNGNGNTSGSVPVDPTNYTTGDTVMVLGNTGSLARTGYTFAGWNTAANGSGTHYVAGASFTFSTNPTLFAKWTANSYTVSFDGNGGVTPGPESMSVTYGSAYGTLATVSRPGDTFNGWYTAAAGGTLVSDVTTVTTASNHTLYAKWATTIYTVTWDANGATAAQTNGGGNWLGANLWWDGSANTTWVPGSDAVFGGPGTAGGAVTLGSPTSVGTLSFNTFTGTYTLGSSGQALTIHTGIDKTSTSAAVSIISPVTLGANQAWANHSTGTLTTSNGTNLVDNNGFELTVGGAGNTNLGVINNTAAALTGSGALIKNGSGVLSLGGANTGFVGDVTVNGGILKVNAPASINGNLDLAGGVYEHYWNSPYTRTLGTGAGQIRITGGTSGFSENGNTGMTVTLNNSAAFEVQWGGTLFNPSILVLQADSAQQSSTITFANKLDLNGVTRTIQVSGGTTGMASATISGVIRNSSGTAGMIKTGAGLLTLSATNTYNGDTTVLGGTLKSDFANTNNDASTVTIATGAILNLNFPGTDTVDKLFIGAIQQPAGIYRAVGSAASGTELAQIGGTGTLTVTSGGGDSTPPALMGMIDDSSGGPVTVGTLVTYAVTFNEDMDAASVTIDDFDNDGTAAVTIGAVAETSPTSGVFTVQATPNGAGNLKLRIKSGAVVKDTAGNDLGATVSDDTTIIVQTPYQAWAGGAAFDADTNRDGLADGLAWLLGAAGPSENALDKLPVASMNGNNLRLTFRCLKSIKRGGTVLKVQSSNDLGRADSWINHEAAVPDADATVNGVVFDTTDDGDHINVIADIPGSGGVLFVRLYSHE